ncbi:MAG TPA: preprotein translocase subunit SecE [Candidatus Limnocylindria bacterium]|nr:preprotein translocase subunit SecE [Candidatus Limnocylindria bacterium]
MAAPARTPPTQVRTGGGGFVRFAQESWSELRKVTWPERDTVIRLTVVVIFVSAVIAVYILGSDQVFTFVVNRVLLNQAIPTPAPSAP